MHLALRRQLNNARQGSASAKTRAEVSGGGRKPWKQKGTGRARAGSTRSPLFAGGGVSFGPKPRDYSFSMPQKARRLALKSALTYKAKDKELVVVEKFDIKSMKTKDIKSMIETMKLEGKVLFIASTETDAENLYMASRNLGYVYIILEDEINCYDLINANNAEKGVYTFNVAKSANKIEIKEAIEKAFQVKVKNINTLNTKPKKKRVGRYVGEKKTYKLAIVSPKEGDSINL